VRFKPDIRTDEGHNAFDLEILVEGILVLEGAAGDTVILTSDAPRQATTDWQGIVVRGAEARAEHTAAVVEYANEGINCYQGEVVVKNSTIRRCSEYGVVLYEGKGRFENVIVTGIGNRGGTSMGISVDRGSGVTIRDSYLIGIQNGLNFARHSTGTVENTMISLCPKRAVLIRNSDPTFTGCTITSNELGFSISANSIPVIHQCNIFENATYDVVVAPDYKGEPVKLDMSGNWWGETSLGLIEERIVDGLDDESILAFVVIDPVLTEAIVREATAEP
jgi:parallel beta-helix repeat protein